MKMRADLLALNTEDLTLLANRGLVKRATREMGSGKLTFELQEDAGGTVAVEWSDGIQCSFPAEAVFEDGQCSCPAVGVCRHLIRSDAIRNDTGAVPQLLVRGHKTDRAVRIGKARFVGLGCGATVRRGAAELAAYLQDTDSGAVVAITLELPDPTEDSGDEPAPLWKLGQRPVAQGVSMGALGGGQLLVQSARRTPGHQLILGRARSSFNPQSYHWDTLRAPVLAEDFGVAGAAVRRPGAAPPVTLPGRPSAAQPLGAALFTSVAGVRGRGRRPDNAPALGGAGRRTGHRGHAGPGGDSRCQPPRGGIPPVVADRPGRAAVAGTGARGQPQRQPVG